MNSRYVTYLATMGRQAKKVVVGGSILWTTTLVNLMSAREALESVLLGMAMGA